MPSTALVAPSVSSLTDRELTDLYRVDRDADAYAELCERHTGMIIRLADKLSRASSRVDRDDLKQLGFVILARCAEMWDAEKINPRTGRATKFSTYAFTAIRNELQRASERIIAGEEPLDPMEHPDDGGILATVPARDEESFDPAPVTGALAKLPRFHRRLIELRYGLNGEAPMPLRELAAAMGLPPRGRLEVALTEAQELLRRALPPRG